MKLSKPFFTALIALSISACAQSSNSSVNPNESHSVSYSINGKTPDEYYKQFILSADPCAQGTYRYYHFMSSDIAALRSDKLYTFDVTLYLFSDNTYVAELTQMRPSGIWGSTYIHVREFEQVGTWKIDGIEIVLDGLGRGQPETYNDSSGFYLSLQNVKADPMFNGSFAHAHQVSSTSILERLEKSCW